MRLCVQIRVGRKRRKVVVVSIVFLASLLPLLFNSEEPEGEKSRRGAQHGRCLSSRKDSKESMCRATTREEMKHGMVPEKH